MGPTESWDDCVRSFQTRPSSETVAHLARMFQEHHASILEHLAAMHKQSNARRDWQMLVETYAILWTMNSRFLDTTLDRARTLREQARYVQSHEVLVLCESICCNMDFQRLLLMGGSNFMPAVDPAGAAASVALEQGHLAFATSDLEASISHYKAALKHYVRMNSPGGQKLAYATLAGAYHAAGDNDQASALCQTALDCEDTGSDSEAESILHTRLGLLHSDRKDYAKALQCFESALAALEGEPESTKAGLFANIGTVHIHLGNLQQGSKYLQSARVGFEETGDRLNEAKVQVNMGHVALGLGHYQESAIHWCQSAIEVFEEHSDYADAAVASNMMGQLSKSFGIDRYADAFESFARAIEYLEKVRGKLGSSDVQVMFQARLTGFYLDIIELFLEVRAELPERFELLLKTLAQEARDGCEFPEYSLSNVYAQVIRKLCIYLYPETSCFNPFSGRYSETTELGAALTNTVTRRAFEYLQRVKSRVFVELLADRLAASAKPGELGLVNRETELDADICRMEEDIRRGSGHQRTPEQLRDKVNEHDRVLDAIAESTPEYTWIRRGTALTFDELRALL